MICTPRASPQHQQTPPQDCPVPGKGPRPPLQSRQPRPRYRFRPPRPHPRRGPGLSAGRERAVSGRCPPRVRRGWLLSQRRFAAGRLLQWGNTLQWAGASSEARRATGSCHCEEEPRGLGCSVWTSGAQTALGTPGVQPHRLGVAWLAPGKSNCASLLFRHSPDLPTWKEGWRGLPATCSHSAHKSVTVEGPPFKKQLLRRAVSRQPLDTGFQRLPPGPSRRPSHWWDGAPPTGARPVADRACCLALGLSQALPPPN